MDDNKDEDSKDENESNDGSDFIEPDSPEAVEAEDESDKSDSDDGDDNDVAKAISDGFEKVLKAIEKNDVESCETRKAQSMNRAMRRLATDDAGTPEAPKSADEVLDEVVDNGDDFENVTDKPTPKDDDQPVGDNEAGSDDEPSYPVDTETDGDKTASMASVMRLVDSYIKAGVIAEANRYSAIERISKLSKNAAANQLKAVKLVTAATDRKIAKIVKAASVKQADIDEPTTDWTTDSLGAGFRRYNDSYYAYAWGDSGNTTPGFQIWSDRTGKGGLIYDQDNMTGTLEEIEAAADAWYEANKQDLRFASRHVHKRASVKKAALDWTTVDYTDYPGMEDVKNSYSASTDKDDYIIDELDDGTFEVYKNGDVFETADSLEEAKSDVNLDASDSDTEAAKKAKHAAARKAAKASKKAAEASSVEARAKRIIAERLARRKANEHEVKASSSRFADAKKARVSIHTASATPAFDASDDMALV